MSLESEMNELISKSSVDCAVATTDLDDIDMSEDLSTLVAGYGE